MDASWLNDQLAQDGAVAKNRYEWFMRPEPKDVLSDVEIDSETGFRYQMRRVGMTRNAAEERKLARKVFIDPLPHVVIDEAKPLQGWYKGRDETGSVRPRPCFTEAVLTEPYGGFCMVGCSFCYINSGMRGYRGTGIVTVPKDYGLAVRKQLKGFRNGAAGYFSSFTDPFLELEPVYHNTQSAAREFVNVGLPIFFLSRLPYPSWAYDLLALNRHSYAQKSIQTPSPSDYRKFSPGALSLEGHMEEIRELRRRGIYVSIQVNPVVPGITSNDQICELFEMLASAGANHVIVKFVEAGYSWAPTMVARMKKRFGADRAAKFELLFVDNIGGQRTIAEEYRLEAHELFRRKATAVGLTYATCYEYRYARNEAGEITSKTGVSIGRDFTTAEQCHGQAVPVYTREREDDLFKPLEVCAPSGCLYCGTGGCHNEGLSKAKARRRSDFNEVVQIGAARA